VFVTKNFVVDFLADISRALSGTKFHYSDNSGFVTDLSQTLLQLSRHVEMVFVHYFRGLCPGFLLIFVCDFHDLCPRLFSRKVSVKVGIPKFWLKPQHLGCLHYLLCQPQEQSVDYYYYKHC